MPLYAKESLETLKQRIDLVEVIEPYIELKRSGASYKALCPFHDEKSPSFMIQKGDSHYHCFGCQAHGDAIEFLMSYLKLPFSDAIEMLAEKFSVHLEKAESDYEEKGPKKAHLKEALEFACNLYQFTLLHTEEGKEPLAYLEGRGINTAFIRSFRIGLAPNISGYTRKILGGKGFGDEILVAAGLLSSAKRDFFQERITFPIHERTGAVIGFSARKWKESTYGGKYVNTSETPLFKKSKTLFGLNYSRREIAKRREAIIVEGQVDALRLIDAGFAISVAGQGTAFGAGHVEELLQLGVQKVFVVMDSDRAGEEACCKIGDLFQRKGVEVIVPQIPFGEDPDEFIQKRGKEAFQKLLDEGRDFLTFLVSHYSQKVDLNSPAGKSGLVQTLAAQIRGWESDLMVHESLKKLASLLNIPEHYAGVGQLFLPNSFVQKSASIGAFAVNADRILESDLIRWLLHAEEFLQIAKRNLAPEDLRDPACRTAYTRCLESERVNYLNLAEDLQVQELIQEISKKIVQKEKAEYHFLQTVQKILDRNWMQKREELRREISSGQLSEEEALVKLKEFDELRKTPPKVALLEASALS